MNHISGGFLNNKYLVFINYSSVHVNSNYHTELIKLKFKEGNLIYLLMTVSWVNVFSMLKIVQRYFFPYLHRILGFRYPRLEATNILVIFIHSCKKHRFPKTCLHLFVIQFMILAREQTLVGQLRSSEVAAPAADN